MNLPRVDMSNYGHRIRKLKLKNKIYRITTRTPIEDPIFERDPNFVPFAFFVETRPFVEGLVWLQATNNS
ncbi:hypothetical protein [Methanosalsum natronophilum]|uniref:hypothetical protein n=1 Tax=Methanosalsum natronophilum TaxID=768733 RepID=UPI002169F414|nr:hypothetical protein [Methanosalsum natronophilum]MCS3924438.1 hypothetical protein [Methanosalsum natronophilum]